MILREAISDVLGDLKASNLDDRYPFKFIAHKLKGKIEIFIKQDSENRAIFNINKIWKPIPCIKLEDADYGICSHFYDYCDVLKKSTKPVPDVYTGRYGDFIKILNVNNSKEYKQVKSFEYKDIKNREYVNKNLKYFWIENKYLFIPDTTTEEVRGIGLFKDSQEVDVFNGNCDVCFKALDSELLVPDYIIDLAKSEVVNELGRTRNIPQDEKPNINSNQKTNP